MLAAQQAPLFAYSLHNPAEGVETIWNEHRESTRGRDLDITGMSYAMLDAAPQQWPLKTGERVGKARLYEDGIFLQPMAKPNLPTPLTNRSLSRANRVTRFL